MAASVVPAFRGRTMEPWLSLGTPTAPLIVTVRGNGRSCDERARRPLWARGRRDRRAVNQGKSREMPRETPKSLIP